MGKTPQPSRKAATADFSLLLGQAADHLQQGRHGVAEAVLDHVLAIDPSQPDALQYLGIIAYQNARFDVAAEHFQRATQRAPKAAGLFSNLGLALEQLDRAEEALACHERALVLRPDALEAMNNRGNALRTLGRLDEAAASYARALRLRPDFLEARYNLAITCLAADKPDEAEEHLQRCTQAAPRHAAAWFQRGRALAALERTDDALHCFDQALAIAPHDLEAQAWKGKTLLQARKREEALACFRQAVRQRPDLAETHYNEGSVLLELLRHEEALDAFDRALAIQPENPEALYNRACALAEMRRHEESSAAFETLLTIAPDHRYTLGSLLHGRRFIGDWTDHDRLVRQLEDDARIGKLRDMPFSFLAASGDPALQLACARAYTAQKSPTAVAPLWQGEDYGHERIRIGYLSSDFGDHPICYLLAGVFEAHDRACFETVGLQTRTVADTPMHQRAKAAFDRFVDLSGLADEDAARRIRALEIDILVDLNGHTEHNRLAILARRPAPVQVNYLGFPGTIGAGFIDYIIADDFVIPAGAEAHYAEKVVRLPDCFQGNDARRAIAARPTRAEAGLPEHGFVFCAFNNTYKITPAFFAVWMRLLAEVPRSVLWLASDDPATRRNLGAEAASHGIDPQRLIFSPRLPYAQHLARFQLADLFLDTLPFNAGTTASDALWSGVPVLTCSADSFAGRMAGSLLHAVGLPELVTADLQQYAALALTLACNPPALAELRERLARNRTTAPLFDTARFCRNLEGAYEGMRGRTLEGRPPDDIEVVMPA